MTPITETEKKLNNTDRGFGPFASLPLNSNLPEPLIFSLVGIFYHNLARIHKRAKGTSYRV
jgi:hypothetical protein